MGVGVTGADQTMFARHADALGYDMITVPEHVVTPRSHVELSGRHPLNAYASMGCFAGATQRIAISGSIALLPLQVDRLCWFATLGVTMSAAPIPPVASVEAYRDYSQWVIEEVKPRLT